MNKTELVAAIAEKADLQKKDAEKAIAAFTEVVAETLKKGDKIQPERSEFLPFHPRLPLQPCNSTL